MSENLPTLLVVDDEQGARLSVKIALKHRYKIILCSSGNEAYAAMNESAPGVAILDLKMANESGLDVLAELKKLDPHIECIMLTGFETLEAAKTAISLGACGFQAKPFDVPGLLNSVARAFRLRQASDEVTRLREKYENLHGTVDGNIRAKDMIRSIALHDLRNHMTVINSYLGLIETGFQPDRRSYSVEELNILRKRIELVQRSVETSLEIMRRQVSLTRDNSIPVGTKIKDFVDDLLTMLAQHPTPRGSVADNCVFISSIPVDTPAVTIAAHTLSTCLLNMILNGIQSSPKQQTISIYAKTHPAQMVLPENSSAFKVSNHQLALHAGPWVEIGVTDQGGGINEDTLARLFEGRYTTKGTAGSGLGLSSIAEAMKEEGGTAFIQTQPFVGTTVAILVPGIDAQPASTSIP